MNQAPPPSNHGPTLQVDAEGASGQGAPGQERRLNSEDILLGAKAVVIQHLGNIYRLQATKQGKLILTK